MALTGKKAILVVSFGTSYPETREKTIDRIEHDITCSHPDYKLYRAWTSKMILKKIRIRDGIHIPNVKEAMEKMIADGIQQLVVQPTHVINGIENDLMIEDILAYAEYFDKIRFGTPLLTTAEDHRETIQAVRSEWEHLPVDEALVLMGHGTTHHSNAVYAALDYTFKDMGYENIFLGTVEAYPTITTLLKQVQIYRPARIHLAPFMIVAGDHAQHDMTGDDPKSWYSQFRNAGYEVACHLKGLGEYKGIRNIFLHHIEDCMI